MTFRPRVFVLSAAAALSGVLFGFAPTLAVAQNSPPTEAACSAPSALTRMQKPLHRVSRLLHERRPVRIVTIGSSSTFGAGASSTEHSYPSRLALELKSLFPDQSITVINHGVNGEESREMLARFDRDVFSENPDLVIWQVGSNSVLRDRPISEASIPLREGLRRLRDANLDVILLNPQYAPKVLVKHEIDTMVDQIRIIAKETDVDVFERFAVMRDWRMVQGLTFSSFLAPDELHMNDWSYACLAKLMAGSIQEASTRATVSATAAHAGRRP